MRTNTLWNITYYTAGIPNQIDALTQNLANGFLSDILPFEYDEVRVDLIIHVIPEHHYNITWIMSIILPEDDPSFTIDWLENYKKAVKNWIYHNDGEFFQDFHLAIEDNILHIILYGWEE